MSTPRKRKAAKDKPAKKPQPKLRSGFEKRIVKNFQEQSWPYEYEKETLPFTVPQKKRNYKPDFTTITRTGKKLYIEGKGKLDVATREKMELVKAQHPDKDIRIIFQRDNPIRKGSKTRYSDWARKAGYQYTISANGTIPESWLQE